MPVCAALLAVADSTLLVPTVAVRVLMVERSSIPDKEVESVESVPLIVPQAEMSALSVVIWSSSCVIGASRRVFVRRRSRW